LGGDLGFVEKIMISNPWAGFVLFYLVRMLHTGSYCVIGVHVVYRKYMEEELMHPYFRQMLSISGVIIVISGLVSMGTWVH
jgi:hypothetical protein